MWAYGGYHLWKSIQNTHIRSGKATAGLSKHLLLLIISIWI